MDYTQIMLYALVVKRIHERQFETPQKLEQPLPPSPLLWRSRMAQALMALALFLKPRIVELRRNYVA